MIINIKWKSFIKNLIIPICVGLLSLFLIRDGIEYFTNNVEKPSFSPPSVLFPIVWTVLYILMGLSAYLIETNVKPSKLKTEALAVYYIQLFFNFMWSILFFNFKLYFVSFIWILILWILIILMISLFFLQNKTAAYIQIPYLLWVSFASVLNFCIFLLNM